MVGRVLLTLSYMGGMVWGSSILCNFCHVARWVQQLSRRGSSAPPVSFVALFFDNVA